MSCLDVTARDPRSGRARADVSTRPASACVIQYAHSLASREPATAAYAAPPPAANGRLRGRSPSSIWAHRATKEASTPETPPQRGEGRSPASGGCAIGCGDPKRIRNRRAPTGPRQGGFGAQRPEPEAERRRSARSDRRSQAAAEDSRGLQTPRQAISHRLTESPELSAAEGSKRATGVQRGTRPSQLT